MSNLAKNLRAYMTEHGYGEEAAAKAIGISQSTLNRLIKSNSSRPIKNPKRDTLEKIATALGLTLDGAVNEVSQPRVAEPAPRYQSQPAQPDLDRLGVALTAIDKALKDVVIQGRLGTLAEALQYAYAETYGMDDIHDRTQRLLFDRIVATRLRDWDERGREAETTGARTTEHRTPAATRPQARRR